MQFKLAFFVLILIFSSCELNNTVLYKKVIITSNHKIEWYTKSGLTNVYPEYLKINHRSSNKTVILEEPEIDDVNLLLGDTLKITYGRHYDLKYLNKKDTIINKLFIRYIASEIDYNSTIRNKTFKGY